MGEGRREYRNNGREGEERKRKGKGRDRREKMEIGRRGEEKRRVYGERGEESIGRMEGMEKEKRREEEG